MRKWKLFFVTVLVLGTIAFGLFSGKDVTPNEEVRIGYFLGGRTNLIYRAYINGYFDKEGVDVRLYTKYLRDPEVFEISKDVRTVDGVIGKSFGKMSGIEIVEGIMRGDFDAGTIGESSFVSSISKGLPLVAVAQLGYEEAPGKAIVMRTDVVITSLEDFKGKTLISRRAGPGDSIFLREFIRDIGLDAEDIDIIDQVDEIDATNWIKSGEIDGGLYHLRTARRLVKGGYAYIYRPMDWMNSWVSHSVLVFRKEYAEDNPENVQKVVNAYMKRVRYEKDLLDSEKDSSWDRAGGMVGEFMGMQIPAYDTFPRVSIGILNEIKRLLFAYGKIENDVDIKNYIDNRFVERIYRELKKESPSK